ncbi:MAG: DUF4932 domain-containing protein [Lachnospiraceae bacterium]|nr:DUF4932 domain-containing protein [Lachnospiraceae bacterium]
MQPIVSEQVELVQVLLYLAGRQERVIQHINNKGYCEAISAYFHPFKNNRAVLLTRQLIDTHSFIHIRPLQAILSLEEIAAKRDHELFEWAIAVKEFIADTDFHAFYRSQEGYYNWVLKHLKQCDFDVWITYIERYFQQKPEEFKLIICPIAGNYGFNLGATVYTVRCMPYYDEEQNPSWTFDFFAKGVAHEYAHCFVNPVVEGNKDLLGDLNVFFESHTNMSNAYNVDYAVMNEYWVRAFTIRFVEENQQLFPEFDIEEEYRRQKESFIYIERFVELLKEFEQTKMNFEEFYLQVMKGKRLMM